MQSLETALSRAGFDHVCQLTDEVTETPYLQFTVGGNGTGKKVVVNGELLSQYDVRQPRMVVLRQRRGCEAHGKARDQADSHPQVPSHRMAAIIPP